MRIGMLFFTLFLFFYRPVSAQQSDPAAEQLLKEVSKKYNAYKSVQVNFDLKALDQQEQATYRDKGTLWLEANRNRYKMITENQELIADGKVLYTILPEEQEIQITDLEDGDEAFTPASIFTFYQRGHKYVSASDEKVGATQLKVVDITPTDTKKSYFKVRLRINPTNKQIYDGTVFDRNGSRYTYTIVGLKSNPTIPENTFTVNDQKYSKFEKVDLR